MTETKSRYIGTTEKLEIAAMHDEGHTLTEIVEMTGRHHSAVSKVLRNAELKRPFKSRDRVLFTVEEMRQLRALADQDLSAGEIAAQMPGRRRETVNSKLQALGYNRSERIPVEKREIVLRLKAEGHTIREIANIVGVGKSTVAGIHSLEYDPRSDDPVLRRMIDGDICRIYSSDGKCEFLVDAADYDILPQTSIHRGSNGYPVARIKGVITYLHHIIMGNPPVGKVVDHINGNRGDCRRSNLRFATRSQNTQNAHRHGQCIGVRKTPAGYRASFVLDLGTFDTREEAMRAYDAKAIELFGEFAMTNKKRGLL